MPTPTAVAARPAKNNRRWFIVVTVVALAGLVSLAGGAWFYRGAFLARQLSMTADSGDIIISMAQAANAFSLSADHADAAGMAVDSALTLRSTVDSSADQIKRLLTITPTVDYRFTALDAHRFRLQPRRPFAPATIYRISLPTLVMRNHQPAIKREFSWALQTQNQFQVTATSPADGSSAVPVTAAIEFRLTETDWSAPNNFFSVSPATPGTFEAHGRTLKFIPNQPLRPGTRYRVMLKRGLAVKGSELSLADDRSIRFDTASTDHALAPAAHDRFDAANKQALQPGQGSAVAVASKPVAVEAVIPAQILLGDQPVFKLRASGSALAAYAPVVFSLTAPSLGMTGQLVTSTAGQPIYISLGRLPLGHHVLMIQLHAAPGDDALERSFDVVESHVLTTTIVTLPATPGQALPDATAASAFLTITDQGRAALLPMIMRLADDSSGRIDAKLAKLTSQQLLCDSYDQKVLPERIDGTRYQQDSGGIARLPSESSDPELSAEVAAVAPQWFDRRRLADYFWSFIDQPNADHHSQITAIAGLAALGEPVLPTLQALADDPHLDWREQLAVGRALAAVGDRERTQRLLRRWLQNATERNGAMSLHVSNEDADAYEATAEAAGIAAGLADPRAAMLSEYVRTNFQQAAFPALARLRYLQAVLSTLPTTVPASLAYVRDAQRQETLDLKRQTARTLTLTQAERKTFRVVQASGDVVLSLQQRVPGRPASVPELQIDRWYRLPHAADRLVEGDLIDVTVTSTWTAAAQDGCYEIHDYLPSGWQAVIDQRDQPRSNDDSGEVSLIACKSLPSMQSTVMHYLARVVARGSYKAEAAFMRHSQYPDVAANGKDWQLTVQ